MRRLTVLLTNCIIASRTGTEVYVLDLARSLRDRGHSPVVWSPTLGPLAEEFRRAGIPIFDRIDDGLPEPDIIHGHHALETLAALSRFPDTPGLFILHDATAWHDEPPEHPRILRYLAVDERCKARLLRSGVDPALVGVVPNSVDLRRFARKPDVAERPRRLLVFSNEARPDTFLPAVEEACRESGLEIMAVGAGVGAPTGDPESVLRDFDIVLAKGKAALEAMAVGCAVIVGGLDGLAGMVTMDNIEHFRRWNFGAGLMTREHDVELLAAEIAKYDAADARACTDFIRANASVDAMTSALLDEYALVLKAWSDNDDPLMRYRREVVSLAPRIAQVTPARFEAANLETANGVLAAERDALRPRAAEADGARAAAEAASEAHAEVSALLRQANRRVRLLSARRDALRRELDGIKNSRWMRIRERIRRPQSRSPGNGGAR